MADPLRLSKAEILGRMSASPRLDIWKEDGADAGWFNVMWLLKPVLAGTAKTAPPLACVPTVLAEGGIFFRSETELSLFLHQAMLVTNHLVIEKYLEIAFESDSILPGTIADDDQGPGEVIAGPWT